MLSHSKTTQEIYKEGSLSYEFVSPPKFSLSFIKRLRPSSGIKSDRFIPIREDEVPEMLIAQPTLSKELSSETPYKRALLDAFHIPDKLLNFSLRKPVVNSGSGFAPEIQRKKTLLLEQTKIWTASYVLQDTSSQVLAWSGATQVHVGLGGFVDGNIIYSKNLLDETGPISCTKQVPSIVYSVVALNEHQIASGWSDGRVRIHHFGLADEAVDYDSTIPVALSTTIHAMVTIDPFTLVCGNSQSQLSLLDSRAAQRVVARVNAGHNPAYLNKIMALAYDGQYYVANGSEDSSVKIWDIRHIGKRAVSTHTAHRGGVKALAFCPNSKQYLMSGGGVGDHSLSLFHIMLDKVQGQTDTGSQVTGLHWLKNDPQYIVTSHGTGDCAVRLWNVSTRERTCLLNTSFNISSSQESAVLSLAGSPTTNDFAVVTQQKSIHFFKPVGLKTTKKRCFDDLTLSCAPTIR